MVQLTYGEMICIRGGILLIDSVIAPNIISPINGIFLSAVAPDTLSAATGDKRTPRPGSGGVSA